MADFNRVGGKVDAQTLAHILKYYGRFGDRSAQIAAYERRRAREPFYAKYGIKNLGEANAQQVSALTRRGLIGSQPLPGTDYEPPEVSNAGNPFGEGGPKVPAQGMTGFPVKGGPAGGRPVVSASPAMASPLQQMLASPPRKRVRNRGFTY